MNHFQRRYAKKKEAEAVKPRHPPLQKKIIF